MQGYQSRDPITYTPNYIRCSTSSVFVLSNGSSTIFRRRKIGIHKCECCLGRYNIEKKGNQI